MLTALPFGANGAKLLIEPAVLQRLAEFRQLASFAPESGGILMGYRRGPHTHVTEATVPSSADIQRRFGFFRHATHHQRVALRRWKETDQMLDYVGEWHTHPEDNPTPSSSDLHHWRDIVAANARPMIFLIIGQSMNWVGAGLRNDTVAILSCSART